MSDPLRPVQSGDNLFPRIRDKRTWNTFIDTAKKVQEHLGDTAHGVKPIIPYIEAYILPASTVQTGYVVSPTGIPHTFPDHSLQAQLRPIFNVAAPSSADDLVMIVTRPVQGGTDFVGRAVVQGLAVVNVEVTDADHEFAVPVASDMTKLVSAATGPVRILYPQDVGEEERMVLIGVGGGGGGGGGTGGGPCALASLREIDCIKLSDGEDDVILEFDTTTWTGTNDRGSWVFGWDAAVGIAYLTLGGTRLMNCGNGCFTGGALTGHIAQSPNGTAEECTGEEFTVCLSCHCCPFEGYDGPGWYCLEVDEVCTPIEIVGDGDECDDWVWCAGPFATEAEAQAECGGIITECCPDDPIPGTLTLTMASACGALNGVFTLTYQEIVTGFFGWAVVTTINGNTRTWTLQCTGGNWSLALWQGGASSVSVFGCGGQDMVEASCNPLHLTLSTTVFTFLNSCREGCSNVALTFDLVT